MPAVTVDIGADQREVHVGRDDGTRLLTHRLHPDQRPSIHPILAPDGVGVLTEDAPAHHPWQHGLYTGFNLVNGIGFWREEAGDGSFHPTLAGPPSADRDGARWSLETRWAAPDGAPLLTEGQDWRLTDFGAAFELELDWALRAEVDLVIGQFMAGGFFLRMPFAPERGGLAVNSEGQENGAAERRRARWVAVAMPIVGRAGWAGMAILDHPTNPAHPVTWRVDDQLGVSPSRVIAGSWQIAAGAVERYRYRVVVFGGTVDRGAIEARWQAFAGAAAGSP